MDKKISSVINKLEAIKRRSDNGGEYWTARELMLVLGYSRWENFETVVLKAQNACENIGEDISDHFREATKMVQIGSSAKLNVNDYFFDRYACYLVAQNGNPSKTEIAAAQTYFAIQTRRQELSDNTKKTLSQRLHLRDRVTKAVKELNVAAKRVGVQNYAAFHNAGYKGLYSMGLANIKKHKGLKPKEDLLIKEIY